MSKPFGKSELFLIENDKLLAPVIKLNGHITFSNKKTDVFNELVSIVISQFISTKAAKAIKNNMLSKFKVEVFKIENFKNLSTLEIKNLGLIDMRLNPIFKNVKYLSDSGMQYRELSLYDAIDKYKILQFLIHPDFWNFKKGINWKTNLNNLNIVKKEELDNLIKKEIIMYDNYILNRNQMDRDFLKDENSTS